MLCARCSRTLPRREGRCPRCYAFNPAQGALALPASERAAAIRIDSDAPVAEPRSGRRVLRREEASLRLRLEPVSGPQLGFALESDPAWLGMDVRPAPPPGQEPEAPASGPAWPRPAARLAAWAIDGSVLALLAALHLALSLAVLGPGTLAPPGAGSLDAWADFLLGGPALRLDWGLLIACLALAYVWLFTAIGGRTPGMALAGLRVVHLRRGRCLPLTAPRALVRATLGLGCGIFGAVGFSLALASPRRQAPHDAWLCCAVVADEGGAALPSPADRD